MILLDTHVLVWMVTNPGKLSRVAVREIRKAQLEGGYAIASISLWELASLYARGRLRTSGTIEASIREIVEKAAINVIEISAEIAGLAMAFPESYPKDPCDRLIGATARALGIALLTQDERLLDSPLVRAIW